MQTKIENFKNIFPFQIGTTSYILPVKENNLLVNVEYLKDSFDKIQLLFFGKDYLKEVMSPAILKRLCQIKKDSNISYSIHLPVDFDLFNSQVEKIDKAMESILKIMEATASLNVQEYILHLDSCQDFNYRPINLNQNNYDLFKLIAEKISQSLSEKNISKLYLENTSYDLTYFKDIILKYNYKICMDIGHLILYEHDFDGFVNCFKTQIGEIHLHGAVKGADHLSLDKTEMSRQQKIISYLKDYSGSVIVEVFNEPDLIKSLQHLKRTFY